MCTVTWRLDEQGYDLFFNRDELRTRLPARAPEIRSSGRTRVIAPFDGDFGGSWISVNEYGVSLALLNGYVTADQRRDRKYVSRGHLVANLADAESTAELEKRLVGTDLTPFRSFRLLALDPKLGHLADWRDNRLKTCAPNAIVPPLISSSFETTAVRQSRIDEFAVLGAQNRALEIDDYLGYHSGHRPERGAYSVCMHRPDAHTVSFSWVQVREESVRFVYMARAPHEGVNCDTALTLPRKLQ